jgi:hypothetical protein
LYPFHQTFEIIVQLVDHASHHRAQRPTAWSGPELGVEIGLIVRFYFPLVRIPSSH